MQDLLYTATKNGVVRAQRDEKGWVSTGHFLERHAITSVVAGNNLVVAGTTDGIFRSLNNGRDWAEANSGLTVRHVRWMVRAPESVELILVGTEPANIFVSRDRGDTWSQSTEVSEFRDEYGWYLPYSPQAGCIRGFAVAASTSPQPRMYAAVEVGGVLVSPNGGDTWQLVEGSDGNPDMNRSLGNLVHPDVHSITVHPSSAELVTAPTGGGLYRSNDGGKSWNCLYRCYCRAVWVDPVDYNHIILGPADGVSRNGRIEQSHDGGQTWHLASMGLEVPWPHHMVERFAHLDTELLAVLSNGELWATQLDNLEWYRLLPNIDDITSVAAVSTA